MGGKGTTVPRGPGDCRELAFPFSHGHGVNWAGFGREVGSVLVVGPAQFFSFPCLPSLHFLHDPQRLIHAHILQLGRRAGVAARPLHGDAVDLRRVGEAEG